jgi:hypothetical protein
MKLTTFQRHSLLALALAATVLAAAWDIEGESGTLSRAQAEGPAQPNLRSVGEAGGLPDIDLEKLELKPPREAVRDAFEPRSWAPPAPKPPPPPPPPPPQAPPQPYRYMGKMMQDNQIVVFLTRQDRNYAVKRGETLDGTYRVDDITGGVMVLTYLPLKQQQTLPIGAMN